MSQSVKKRVAARTIAGSAEEFDALADALKKLCEVDRARWELSHRDVDGFTTTEPLAKVRGLEVERSKALTLWVGDPFAVRRVTMTADVYGVRIDVWGETPDWVHDAAAVVERRARAMRPWWWVVRTGIGAGLLTMTINFLLLAIATIGYRLAGLEFWSGTYWIAAIVGLVTAVSISTVGAPGLRIGPRERFGGVAVRLSLFLAGAVVSGFVGVAIGWALTGQPSS